MVSYLPTRRQLCLKGQSVVFVCGHACHAVCLEREGGCHLSLTGEEVWTCILCHTAPARLGPPDSNHLKVGAGRLVVYSGRTNCSAFVSKLSKLSGEYLSLPTEDAESCGFFYSKDLQLESELKF
jgi:hypothetical protein